MSILLRKIKNIPSSVFETLGNTGKNFPYKGPIPDEPICPLVLQENRQISIFTEDGTPILIECTQ